MAEEEDFSPDDRETVKRNRKIEELDEYVKQMAYKPVKPPAASDRTEELAQMRKRNIIGTYVDHKDAMEPKERAERAGRLASKPIYTNQLEDLVQKHRKKEAKSEQFKKHQQILFHETLFKLKKQCEEQLMNAIVTKFAAEVGKRATSLSPANVETESYQRLQKSLICNMFLALKIPFERQSQDYTIYSKLASVLADLILQGLFLAQNTTNSGECAEKETPQTEWPEDTDKDRCIKMRALRAAKKKLHHKRKRCARFGGGSVSSNFY